MKKKTYTHRGHQFELEGTDNLGHTLIVRLPASKFLPGKPDGICARVETTNKGHFFVNPELGSKTSFHSTPQDAVVAACDNLLDEMNAMRTKEVGHAQLTEFFQGL